jgi:hypothetical protein
MSVTDLGTYDVNNITFTTGGTNFATITVIANGQMQYSSTASGGTVQLKNITDPSVAQDAATKAYVDSLVSSGITWKTAVNVASSSPVTLSATTTGTILDGTTLASGWRILLKDQANAAENGIYVVTAGTPFRSSDALYGTLATGAACYVDAGDTNYGTVWVCNTTTGATFNTVNFGTAIGFVLMSDITPAAGSNTQVQYNNGGAFGASSNFTFNSGTNTLTVNGTVSATTGTFSGPISATNGTFTGAVSAVTGTFTYLNADFLNVTSLATFGPISATSITANFISATSITSTYITVTTLTVTGPSNFANITVTSLTVSGPSVFNGTLTANTTATFNGTVNMNGTLNVTSLATFGPISATSATIGTISVTSLIGGAAGLNTQIQYRDTLGNFAAYSGLTVTTSTNTLSVGVTTSGVVAVGPNLTVNGTATDNSITATGAGAFTMTNTAAQAVNLFNTTTTGALSMGTALTSTFTLGNSAATGLNTSIYGTTISMGTASTIVYVKGTAAASSTSTGALVVAGGAGFANDCYSTRWRTVSDAQFKTNINRLSGSLDLVNKLEGYSYNWKEGFSGYSETKAYGVIAQQLESAGLGDLIATDATNSKTVDYNGIIPFLIEAVKELSSEMKELKGQRTDRTDRTEESAEKTSSAMIIKRKKKE